MRRVSDGIGVANKIGAPEAFESRRQIILVKLFERIYRVLRVLRDILEDTARALPAEVKLFGFVYLRRLTKICDVSGVA